jgi:chaperonin cofactor prefoldin
LRFPTSNALSQKIIGQVKKLQELEAELSAFALDIQNKALSLQDEIVGEITGKVDEAVKEATDEIKAATTKPATPPATPPATGG